MANYDRIEAEMLHREPAKKDDDREVTWAPREIRKLQRRVTALGGVVGHEKSDLFIEMEDTVASLLERAFERIDKLEHGNPSKLPPRSRISKLEEDLLVGQVLVDTHNQ